MSKSSLTQANFANMVGARAFSTQVTFKLPEIMGVHRLDKADLPTEATTNKEEMMFYFEQLATMRRLEVLSDMLYKKREIRGFCHLYDG